MTTHAPSPDTMAGADAAAVRKAIASTARPARAGAATAALSFAWRGMLKVKHVPEQLLDVTVTPVMFLLMFTYLFGGAIEGSPGNTSTTSCPACSSCRFSSRPSIPASP